MNTIPVGFSIPHPGSIKNSLPLIHGALSVTFNQMVQGSIEKDQEDPDELGLIQGFQNAVKFGARNIPAVEQRAREKGITLKNAIKQKIIN